jgi:hypothetical protein
MSPLNPLTSNVNLGKDTKRILYNVTPNYTERGFKGTMSPYLEERGFKGDIVPLIVSLVYIMGKSVRKGGKKSKGTRGKKGKKGKTIKGGTEKTTSKNKTIKKKLNKKAIAEKEKKEIEKTRPLHFHEYEEWYETVAEQEMNSQLPYIRYVDEYNK